MKHVNHFFDTHPEHTEVHEALGVLFIDKEAADNYMGGVTGHEVKMHVRPVVETEPPVIVPPAIVEPPVEKALVKPVAKTGTKKK